VSATATATKPETSPAITAVRLTVSDLTAMDRCEHRECPAAALAVATLASGGQLTFCMHHAKKLTAPLATQGATLELGSLPKKGEPIPEG
jgi:hypothetical protein